MGHMMDLSAVDPSSTDGAPGDKKATEAALGEMNDRLRDLQEGLWAEAKRSVLVVLQAMDTGGKDGTIKHVFRGLNPVGARVASFKAPSDEEKRHDFLWRVHKVVPAAGELVVFNRSHYEDVLIVRVHEWVTETVWRERYDRINEFEQNLADAGTTIVKFWLHISPDEQKRRLEARLDDPKKRWKFNPEDLDERKRWPAYMEAAADMIDQTSTAVAPWHVVPANHKWYRNWVVSSVLLEALEAMDPRPPVPDGAEHYVIPDVPL
jgi:PPK2 family polyphosphate:nucleotide phosphotransferase